MKHRLHRTTLGLLSTITLSLTAAHSQTTGTWNLTPTTGLTWNTVGNWTGLTGGLVPNAIDATPNFTSNITVAKTITLDGDKTVGTLSIDDAGTTGFFGFTLNSGTPTTSQLIFDVSSGSAGIKSETATNTAANTIGAPITLNDPLIITNTKTNVQGTLNLNGVITDGAASLSITKLGNGIVQLAGANTYDGGTLITAGRLGAGNATSYGTSSVTVDSGGQAWLSSGATYANNFTIAGNGYANTADAGALNGAIRFNGSTTSGTITIAADTRIGAYNGGSGTLAGPLIGSAALEVNQSAASHNGNLILTGNAGGYTGTITVTQGTLRLGTASNLGGSLVVKDGANLYVENIGTPGAATVGTDSGATRSLTLGNPGSTTTGPNLVIDPSTNEALQVNGDVTLNGTTTVNLPGVIASNPVTILTYSGTLTGGPSNLTLPGGLAGYRAGTQFTTTGGEIKLDLVQGAVTWTGAASGNWNTTEQNWHDGTNPATFFNLDAVTFDDTAATKAAFTTNLANATQNDLVFTAVASGAAGEAVMIEYVLPGLADSPLGVTVTGSTISVSLGTDSLGAISSTASAIKTAIEASGSASALVTVALVASNDGTGLVAALSATPLVLTNPTVNLATGVNVAPGDMTFNHNAIDYTVSGSGAITGGGSLTKSGSGMLSMSTANTFSGGATLTSGRLRIGNTLTLGTGAITITGGQLSSIDTATRTMANGAVMSGSFILGDATNTGGITLNGASTLAGNTIIDVPSASTHTFGGAITDGASSFSLTKLGTTSTLALNGANTYDGGTAIDGGRINAGTATSFGTGPVTVSDGSQAFLTVAGLFANAFTLTGIGFTETAGNLGAIRLTGSTISGLITLAGNSRLTAHGSTGTLAGAIGQSGGPAALELSNYNTGTDSTITVAGDNTYSGGTTVKGAIVIANHNNAFGTGEIIVQSNGTAARVTRVQLGANVVLPAANSFVLDSDASTAVSAITSFAGDNTTISTAIVNGPVEILKKVGGGGHFASTKGSASVLRVMGAVTSPNGVSVVIRQGTVELGGGGDYAAIEVVDGLLKLAADNGLATTSTLSIGTSGTVNDTGTFDLNGFAQSLSGLGTGARPATVTNSGFTPSTLTLNLASSATYSGTFVDGISALNLIKTGGGTLTLSGNSNSFTGGLSVSGGGLVLTGTLGGPGATASFGTNTSLSGEGTFGGNLTLSGTTLDVNGSTPLGVLASGTLNTTGGVTVNLQSLPATPGPIEVIAFGGTLTGAAGDFTLAGGANYRSPVFSVAANAVNLTLGVPVNLTWTGTGGSDWDINTTSNWNNPTMAPSTFLYADNVTFGNTGGGTIGVPANVNASNLVINSNDNWSFQGVGTVAAAAVTKDGTGSATFENPVNFSGTIALTTGALRLSPPTGVTSSVAATITGGGTLAKGGEGSLSIPGANAGFTGSMVISKGEVIPGNNAAFGAAKIVFGDATTTATDVCTLTLNTGIALATSQLEVAPACLNARIASTGGTIAGTTITKKGAGKLTIGHATNPAATASVLTGTSPITIEAGTLAGSSMTPISSSTTITMGNANTGTAPTILEVPASQSGSNDFVTLACPLVLSPDAPNSEAIIRYAGGPSVLAPSFTGAISLNGRDLYLENTSNVNTPTRLYNVRGVISGNGNVRVRGGSGTTIRVQANNTFTGDLYMLSGRIQTEFNTNGVESIPNNARIIMSAGASVGLSNTAETIRGLVGGAATEAVTTSALINQGRGDSNLCRLTVSDSNAANTHVFDGRINDGGGPIALTKAGAATQVLNGPCAFTGTTLHTAGKLVINNTFASAITVSAGATLGGNMTSTAAITATAAAAKIAPGNSTGTMTAASVALNTGGVLDIEIDDSSTPKNDKLAVTGALNITSATLNLTVAGTPGQSVYVLASYGTLTGTFGTVTGKPSNYDLVYNYNDGVSSNNIALVLNDPYVGWLATYPALTGANRAPNADFDNDGLANGVEFVIGSNPTTPTTSGLPGGVVSGANLVFTFKRSDASETYAVSVETSTDLLTWPPAKAYAIPTIATTGPPVTVVDNGPATLDDVTVTIPMAPDAKKFARLKAVIPFTP